MAAEAVDSVTDVEAADMVEAVAAVTAVDAEAAEEATAEEETDAVADTETAAIKPSKNPFSFSYFCSICFVKSTLVLIDFSYFSFMYRCSEFGTKKLN